MGEIKFNSIKDKLPPPRMPVIIKGFESYIEKDEDAPPIIAIYSLRIVKKNNGHESIWWDVVGAEGYDCEPSIRVITHWAEIPNYFN